MSYKDETVEIEDCTCIRETKMAILVTDGQEEYWIPKALVDDDSEVYETGNEGTLIIPEWLALDKGLI